MKPWAAYLDSISATIRQPLVVFDGSLRVVSASSSIHRIFSSSQELIGLCVAAAGDPLNVPALREFLASIQTGGATTSDYEVESSCPAWDDDARS